MENETGRPGLVCRYVCEAKGSVLGPEGRTSEIMSCNAKKCVKIFLLFCVEKIKNDHKGLFYVQGYFNSLLFNARELLLPQRSPF